MVLMRDRRAEQRKDPVDGGLRYVAAVMMDRIHHQLQRRVDQAARLLRIEVLHQVHRALDVGEQRRYCLALAVDGFCICRGLAHSDRWSGLYLRCRKWCGTLSAEFEARRVFEAALGAGERERRGALAAKFHSTRIFEAAF